MANWHLGKLPGTQRPVQSCRKKVWHCPWAQAGFCWQPCHPDQLMGVATGCCL